MLYKKLLTLTIALFACTTAATKNDCGVGTPCSVALGEYHLAFPDAWDRRSPLPVLIFFHGHGSSGENIIKSKRLRAVFGDAGYLLAAPTGKPWPGHQARGWAARPNVAGNRDNIRFTHQVLDDIARRWQINPQQIFAAGYSSGGSMAWYLACYSGGRFAGFASIAGGLRPPLPAEQCPSGPFSLIHFHGFADRQVPLEGRRIADWHQGDVFNALALLRSGNSCRSNPTSIEKTDIYHCRIWQGCGSGKTAQFCLHDGGHFLPQGWTTRTLQWFEAL